MSATAAGSAGVCVAGTIVWCRLAAPAYGPHADLVARLEKFLALEGICPPIWEARRGSCGGFFLGQDWGRVKDFLAGQGVLVNEG